MFSKFFTKTLKDIELIDRKTIKNLTSFRRSGYDWNRFESKFSEMSDRPALKYLVHKLGSTLLRTRIFEKPGQVTVSMAEFSSMIDQLFSSEKNLNHIVYFAAQLLQYYTILCDKTFTSDLTLEQLNQFLEKNSRGKFGDAQLNRFIIEYKLIKMYNELAEKSDVANEKTSPYLLEQWKSLQTCITEALSANADCVFLHYLNFVLHYSRAKATELDFRVLTKNKSFDSAEDLDFFLSESLIEEQRQHIIMAKNALERAENLLRSKKKHILGVEFCFGQGLFTKFPVQNMEKIRHHLNFLC